jgi:hypothetical protein
MFVDLFASYRGRPPASADVVASVMVLQALEGLSDRARRLVNLGLVNDGGWSLKVR